MAPKELDLDKVLRKGSFRVSIFGSARIPEEDPIYKETFSLASEIAKMGADLITGGGPGLMAAASEGHTAGDPDNVVQSIGLNIRLPFEQEPNEGLDVMETHERFSTRLDDFMLFSNVVVVMPGGVGTCLEFFYTWQLIQVNHICKIPVILVGEMWKDLIKWVIDQPLRHGYLDSDDLGAIVVVDHAEEAIEVIKEAQEKFNEADGDVCVNWKKYCKVQGEN